MKKIFNIKLCSLIAAAFLTNPILAQEAPKEDDYLKIVKIPAPESALLEIGGLVTLPNGNLALATRRGDVYIVENPTSTKPYFRKFASGLHEALGLAYKDGALYTAQRGELTKLVDTDHDGVADVYETVYAWPISGHYHEYSFGPKITKEGSFLVTTNVAFGDEEWWRGESRVPWRGWALEIFEDGRMLPWSTGMRSPAGIGMLNGEFFYTENQGDWIASGGLWSLPKGSFVGHPAGLVWTDHPDSPLKLKQNALFDFIDERRIRNDKGRAVKPENIVDEDFKTMADAKTVIPELQLPAVWLPHGILGISSAEPIVIPEGHFGPFAGQILVADQGMSMISRVVMEKVNGEYQGAAIAFRSGFRSGILRMDWAKDGSLFIGETNRGWGSAGDANEGLERLVYVADKVPFEMKTVKAMPDGFEIEFTQPVDKSTAEDLASYSLTTFTYKYNSVYGSPPVNNEEAKIKGVQVSADGMKVRIVTEDLKRHYIHNLTVFGVLSAWTQNRLLHPTAYYTLNQIPSGSKLSLNELSTYNSDDVPLVEEVKEEVKVVKSTKVVPAKKTVTTEVSKSATVVSAVKKAPTYKEVEGLLVKHTCTACHTADKKQIGPSYKDVAKRKYSNEKIVQLIYNPQPENWPDYPTIMPPMPQVPKADALKIAEWINSLK